MSSNDVSSIITSSFLKGILMGLKILWPLWLLIFATVLIKILFHLWELRRLSKSGIKEIDQMDGLTFEKYLQSLFRNLGYRVERTAYIGDYGADLIVSKDGIRTVVQAKRYSGKANIKAIQEVVASKAKYHCTEAMVVTNSYFTKPAIELAKANGVKLWDRDKLVNALLSIKKDTGLDDEINEIAVSKEQLADMDDNNACAICGKSVSEKVKQYCLSNPQRFGGKVYCYEHQKNK
ncbi:restriction endonuclease [Thermoanaerobacterium thermosaccharolyticum]|uniref:Restriction endonuclease n=1 Tax=Thermoanaerobacterium thermosaccharolyticum TaxID=1517 RepID=A0A223I1H1_THETR|nr:restriction endonuclease [Thermoanaerobacterium thermosaccharolyticum]AST58573.1 restriction endonuclease [Thermoanaerobacterium thermosaccharolyticum]